MRMHIIPFGEKHDSIYLIVDTFHLITLLAISMVECLVANIIVYCVVCFEERMAS